MELKEFEWYLRDIIFRYYNEEKREIDEQKLPEVMQMHLRYKHVDRAYIKELANQIIPRLTIIKREGNRLIVNDTLERYQCKDCFYISYIANTEELACSRCNSTNIKQFIFHRKDEVQR